jgi:hypothetical protein
MTLAAKIIADDTFHVFVLIAAILFVVACVLAVIERAFVIALLSAGLAFFAFAWVVVS